MAQTQIQCEQKQFIQNTMRQPYQKIGNDIREKVIYDIVFQENSIKQTALKYGLKYSTANGIVQTYQQQGRSMKKDKRNKKQYYKRNKILVVVDLKSGDLNLYQQQTTSNVLIIESSINPHNVGNFKQPDQFRNSKECTQQFILQDIESISNNLIFWMKQNMKFGNSKNDVSFNNFKTQKRLAKNYSSQTQQEIQPTCQLHKAIRREEFQKKYTSNSLNYEKNKKDEEHIDEEQSDQMKNYFELPVNSLDKNYTIDRQLGNMLSLWKQQIFLMSQQ
ncbi:unnamed protein product (macronuclear) [Paramecium tetraurelia]|uniref:HTH psq-type domain-containing protein n=1 Tax=Paramecium tetraurelia TaxID=5888 RepID=A0E018_PARTE|nr:uncharacterized protein GSPATT00021803001 [Paramecium tetraurelia]CAK88635.1 unnamed protein product [Paramecium tetraurelia]|eukprot:XP_001456032.1 hypothetical protein (macronuclear) [Paramecium tetraurelia strain d4-2]